MIARKFFSALALALLPAVGLTQDTLAPASLRYQHPGLLKRVFLGGNYRKTWATPVQVPLFRIKTTHTGYTVSKLGGGQQTKSLQVADTGNREMVIRTLDKTVDKAMEAKNIRSGFLKNITQDMISAAHPYGAFTVPPIARAVGVVSSMPTLFYVPDDPGMGEYQSIFANQMVMLEQRKPALKAGDQVRDTEELLTDLTQKRPVKVDLPMLLQARLIDMLIGDWDRHGGQWKWGFRPSGDSTYVYPIPVDHDQAFFHSNGILVSLVRPFAMKHLVGFKPNMRRIRKLNRKEWDFDRYFIGRLSQQDWELGIRRFQTQVTDAVLQEAVAQIPDEIEAIHGQELLEKLQGRRNTLLRDGMRYYAFLKDRPMPDLLAIEKARVQGDTTP